MEFRDQKNLTLFCNMYNRAPDCWMEPFFLKPCFFEEKVMSLRVAYSRKACVYEEIKAIIFAFFLVSFVLVAILYSILGSGPLILGTELNGNGTVEYLCLGDGCENLRDMDW